MAVGGQGEQVRRQPIRWRLFRTCRRSLPGIFLTFTMLTAAAWLLGSVLWVDLPHSHPYAANVRNAQPSAAAVVNDPNKSSSKRKQSGAAHERPAPVAASARALKARAKTGAAIAEVAPPHNGSAASNGRVDPQRLLRKFPFPLDPPDTLDPNADGRTVRHLCGAGNVEHVIFVHTDPTHRRERNLFRATVGHPRVASLLKWSVLFLVGLRPGFNVTDEAAKFGDVVQLPFFDHYRNLSLKFLNGMRWVMLNCPAARSVVKVDDDVFLHPEVLSAYLRTQLRPGDRRLHCAAYRGNAVIRNPHSRHYLSVHDYPAKHFPTHCRGLLVIIPAPVMWDLYVAAFRLPVHAIDDAYVTGDLAKAASLGHRDITRMLWAEDDKLLEVLRGEYMCAFFTGRSKLAVRANLWKTLSHIKKRRDLDEAMQSTLVNFR